MLDVIYHNGFEAVNHSKKGKPGSGPGPHVPAAALTNTNSDHQGKVWQNPFYLLAQYGLKGIKGPRMRAMAGAGICPICICAELPRHIPTNTKCPLLAELNLKLITCLPVASSPSLGTSAPAPLPSPASAPSPSSRAVAADTSSVSASLGSSSAPSGLIATVAQDNPTPGNFDSDEEFYWEGNNLGVDYASPLK